MADKAVKRIRPADRELSDVQENLANAVDQLLKLANTPASAQLVLAPVLQMLMGMGTPSSVKTPALQVQGRADGNLQQNQPTIIFGNPAQLSPNAVSTPQRDAMLTLYGQIVAYSSTSTASTIYIVPQTSGSVFTIASIGNTTRLFTIDATGTAVGQSFVSAAGFKNVMPIGKFQNSGYNANAMSSLGDSVQNQGGLGGMSVLPFEHRVSHAGSIVGLNLMQSGTNAGQHSLMYYRNATLSYTWTAGTGTGKFYSQFPKGTAGLTFAAGDSIYFIYRSTAANNVIVQAFATLEMVA